MRERSLLGVAAMVLICGAFFSGCKKSESDESTIPAAEATPTAAMGSEPTPAPSLTSQVAGAQLAGPGGVSGVITFTQDPGGVHVVARVEHAKPGKHGFHLHAAGVCDAPGFKGAGDHFNPTNAAHGAPDASAHHAGDFGNIEVGADGTGNLDLQTTMLAVDDSANGVVGKAVILHAGTDDLKTQPSGNSGDRIACGVVTRAQGQAETTPAAAATPGASDVLANPTPTPNGAEH
jgi:Cu-Zn family superoxide dismutase